MSNIRTRKQYPTRQQTNTPTPTSFPIGIYRRRSKTGTGEMRCRVIARTASGNYIVELPRGTGFGFRRSNVLAKNLTVHGGN